MITALPLAANATALAPEFDSETAATIHEWPDRAEAVRRQRTARRPARENHACPRVGERHISEILPGVLARYLRSRGETRQRKADSGRTV